MLGERGLRSILRGSTTLLQRSLRHVVCASTYIGLYVSQSTLGFIPHGISALFIFVNVPVCIIASIFASIIIWLGYPVI